MSSNEANVRAKYKNGEEELRATQSRFTALEFHYTKKHLAQYIHPEARVLELGFGTGYYAMEFSSQCKEYTGVDIVPEHIACLQEKIDRLGLKNVTAQWGDATNLPQFADESFDVVLCLGPLYHLPAAERAQVFAQCRRICKRGGIAAFAYINKIGVYAGACVHDSFRAFYPNATANELILRRGQDDANPDLFYFTMPEEMEALAKEYGFRKLKNLGTDFFFTMSIVEAMDDEKFAQMEPLLDEMANYESCTGMSNHGLLVCRNEAI